MDVENSVKSDHERGIDKAYITPIALYRNPL